jgi:hypothetical protein
LQDRSEFAAARGKNITTDDLLAFIFQIEGKGGYQSDFRIVNDTDITTNLIDADTNNKTLSNNVPAKIAEYTYRYSSISNEPDGITLLLLVVLNDPETGQATGYSVGFGVKGSNVETTPPGTLITMPPILQVFDSFELVTSTAD